MTNKKSPISKWTDFDVFVGTKNMTAKTSDPSLKGSVSLQYFLGRSGGTTWLGCVTRWQQLVTAPAQHNEEVTKNWGWRSWRFLLLFPIISSIYIYTHTSCVQDVLVYGIRRRASKGHVSKLPRYGTRTYISWFSLKPQLCRLPFLSSPFFNTCPASCRSNRSHSMYPSRARWDYILYKMILIRFHQQWKKCNHSSLYNSQAFNPFNINLNHFISITMFCFRKRNLPFFPGEKIPSIPSPSTHSDFHIVPAKASDVDMNMASGRSLLPDPSWVWSCKCQHASVAWKPTV